MSRVSEFNDEYGLELDPERRMLDLESETGELAKELLEASDYGTREVETTPELVAEFGDVYYALLSLAAECGIDPEGSLEASLAKYRERLDASGSAGSS
ncbi:MazG-like family protein [Halalkalicoccus jeotgali]|uniref:MazG nucleotide pyrophosphohydrolase n=1 Tax=Halalkalicoccus jeotgali (strain DSM 18796 / CECT 7217 / JCM 14584 / KCTC 4019 / B3) TaxID=795797 RepID=D8J9T0_HALJB|nr:MazG-like family protein [Halalkalicoccus jeotgali]ADJ16419.1 MazG nucleotide pyrophosphohydrolase [Halalkalicoccus jeotgali B3]ELY37153.1 MazG nucleotide pyrophosphohydrolase [Halalkalicoccus jeotgali B3]